MSEVRRNNGGSRAPILDETKMASENKLPRARSTEHILRQPANSPGPSVQRSQSALRNPGTKQSKEKQHEKVSSKALPLPSKKYLDIASALPCPVTSDVSRKLIILDLNGSLVLRSKRASNTAKRAVAGTSRPALRVVHQRPYTPTFMDYLFHPENMQIFDIMVWSSAQPYSVQDMVEKAFGNRQSDLVATWARDTLDLTKEQYHHKTPTVKDLDKTWVGARIRFRHSQPHSAHTTLLFDDSTTKAGLQPYNHVCLREYSHSKRERDVAQWENQQRQKKSGQDGLLASGLDKQSDLSSLALQELDIDDTLIAIIGILEEAKKQGNIAAWIREGGLYRGTTASDIPPPLWFENENVFQSWLEEGWSALDRLKIKVVHGITS